MAELKEQIDHHLADGRTSNILLEMKSWRFHIHQPNIEKLMAESLNETIYKTRVLVLGYLITHWQIYLVLKCNTKKMGEFIHQFEKVIQRQFNHQSHQTKTEKRVPIAFNQNTSMFKKLPFYNAELIYLLTGETVDLPYYNPNVARLNSYLSTYYYCSVSDYKGCIGPVYVNTYIMKKTKWSKSGTEIFKNGKATFLAGVAYSPIPCGAGIFEPQIGDWFTPPWNEIWERDFPLMKAAGIDNIRTYFFWAWAPPKDMTTWKNVVSQPPTYDHKAFLDAAHANGISVTIGIALDGGNIFDNSVPSLGKDYFDFYLATMKKLASLYGDHPAVMGFCIGNEQNTPSRIIRADFWNDLETMAKAVKKEAPDKLVLFAMQNDNPNMFTAKITGATNKSVPQRFAEIFDAWGLNIYSGMSGTLENYNTYVVANTNTALPCIITEWGVPGGENVPTGQPGPPAGKASGQQLTPAQFKAEITNTMNPDGVSIKNNLAFVAGTQWFEWTDEWWKNAATPVYEQNASPNPNWPEEFWGLNSIAPNGRTAKIGPWDSKTNSPFPADILTARPTLAALTKLYKKIKGGINTNS